MEQARDTERSLHPGVVRQCQRGRWGNPWGAETKPDAGRHIQTHGYQAYDLRVYVAQQVVMAAGTSFGTKRPSVQIRPPRPE
jgi:hypothetical protein